MPSDFSRFQSTSCASQELTVTSKASTPPLNARLATLPKNFSRRRSTISSIPRIAREVALMMSRDYETVAPLSLSQIVNEWAKRRAQRLGGLG